MKSDINNLQSDSAADKGFTLIELLIATAIMSLVVTLAGTAFVGILQQNKKAEFETQRRTNLNRALDYIANEIRMANQIEPGVSSGEVIKLTTSTPGVTGSPGSLQFNNFATSTVSYSIANSTGVWADANSKSINRTITSVPTPTAQFLVDAIKAPPTPSPSPTTPNSDPPNTTTDCPSPATFKGTDGFYACIYPGGRKVDLYLYGKLSNDPNDPDYNKPIKVKSTAYTRSTAPNF